jgi:hypothetical protein
MIDTTSAAVIMTADSTRAVWQMNGQNGPVANRNHDLAATADARSGTPQKP